MAPLKNARHEQLAQEIIKPDVTDDDLNVLLANVEPADIIEIAFRAIALLKAKDTECLH